MKYRYLSDCHVHTACSSDASDSAVMMCESAARHGLFALTITDHCECQDYKKAGYDRLIRQSYFEARRAADVFRNRLKVHAGIELGQPLQGPKAAEDILAACDFDFVLASLHNLKGKKDFYELDYSHMKKDTVYSLLREYYQQVEEMVEWGNFDSLAHLSYPLRYIVGEHHIDIDISPFIPQIDRILKKLIAGNKALEVNTSGLRQELGKTMPGYPIIKRFREFGGKFVTLGSDAHRWADVAGGVEHGLELLERAGFSHFTVFVEREPHQMPIR